MQPGHERMRTLVGLVSVLMIFVLAVDLGAYSTQKQLVYREAETHLTQELKVVGDFILEATLRGDYTTIERFLVGWGQERPDIVEVKGIAPSGFVLAHYERPEPPQEQLSRVQMVRHEGRVLLTLQVSQSMDPLQASLRQLALWLLGGSALFLVGVIGIFWYIISRMALQPMEAEISRRRQAESLLQTHRDQLDELVRVRTAELTETNQRLIRAVEVRTQAEQRLREREQVLNHTLRALRELHRINAAVLFHDDKLRALLELGLQHFKLDIGILSGIEGERYTITALAAPPEFPLAQGDVLKLKETYCDATVGTDEPVYLHHAGESEWRFHPAYARYGFEAYIGARLVVVGKPIGTLCFLSTSPRETPFSPSDGEVVKLMAQWLAAEMEREESARERVRLANYDGLTGLPNRNLFYERLGHALAQAKRRPARAALLALDLDGFKYVNDTLGNVVGDRLLQDVATRLRPCVREEDTLCRIGGDEFTIIMENIQSIEIAATMAQKLNDAIAQPFRISDQEIFISCSIGIALFPDDSRDHDTLVQQAIAAMYRSKARGTGRFLFFTEEISRLAQKRLLRERGLREALRLGQFELCYQPEVEMLTGCIASMEALIRWRHPEEGLLEPNNFIGVAEDTGLIRPMGRWVLLNACRQHHDWQEQALKPPPIGVNLSARQLHDQDLLKQMAEILEETGLNPNDLILELTETALLQDLTASVKILGQLRDMGTQISVDDFGAGYASLSYLKQLPLDVLKIDQSFIRDLAVSSNADAIVDAILRLAHQLRLTTVAEGIETEQQFNFLLEHGCDIAQGYLLSLPLPTASIPTLLADREKRKPLRTH